MADNYLDQTGYVKIKTPTKAFYTLFGIFHAEKIAEEGKYYIAQSTAGRSTTWEALAEAIFKNYLDCVPDEALRLLVTLANAGIIDEIDDDEVFGEDFQVIAERTKAPHCIALAIMAVAMGKTLDSVIENLHRIKKYDYCDDIEWHEIFNLAVIFDDGHGIEEIKVESAYTCSKLRMFEFGGFGTMITDKVNVCFGSFAAISYGEEMTKALRENNLSEAGEVVAKFVRNNLLDAVNQQDAKTLLPYIIKALETTKNA